jgi:pectate lyase C
LSATQVINGTTFDGGCRTYNPSGALGDGSQDEGQDPAFRLNGGTLQNAILGNNGVDGVHFYGSGTLRNFRWTNVGEDAFTLKEGGTINISQVTANDGEDKYAQVNAAGTVNVSACNVNNMAKFLRQNGGTTFKITATASNCTIGNQNEGIFRTDSSSSVASLTNSTCSPSGSCGDEICIGPWASCTNSGNSGFPGP